METNLLMTNRDMELKLCSGIYGHYFCVEHGSYEKPMLPLSEFHHSSSSFDGKQAMCKWCKSENGRRRTDRPKSNMVSDIVYRDAGGTRIFYGLPKEERLQLRSVALEEVNKVWKSTPHQKSEEATFGFMARWRSDKEYVLPKIYKEIKRQPPKQEKIDYPPEGYVYVFRNRWHPEGTYKIGSTDNLEGRRSAARTWGPYDCEFYLEVKDCKLVESMVHDKLKDYRIEADDLGKEHFSVDLDKATAIIKEVAFEVVNMHPDCTA